MRCFIAFEVPERFAFETACLARQLATVVEGRFMARDTYHLTVAFLGDVGQREVDCAIAAIDEACSAAGPVVIESDGLGKFGKPRDATLWMGIRGGEALGSMAALVREGLRERGVPFDGKPFKPHITIARRARIPKGELPPVQFPQPVELAALTLFKSELSPQGATYKPLHSSRLAAASR